MTPATIGHGAIPHAQNKARDAKRPGLRAARSTMRAIRTLIHHCQRRLAARWDHGQPWTGGVMTAAPKQQPQVTPRRCRNCGRDGALHGVLIPAMPRDVTVYACDECDTPHCPHCRAYNPATAVTCTECGTSLQLSSVTLSDIP